MQGEPGAQGAPGASAYEVAVENGFVGDTTAWLASLRGPQGEPGTPGSTPETTGTIYMAKGQAQLLGSGDRSAVLVSADLPQGIYQVTVTANVEVSHSVQGNVFYCYLDYGPGQGQVHNYVWVPAPSPDRQALPLSWTDVVDLSEARVVQAVCGWNAGNVSAVDEAQMTAQQGTRLVRQ